MPIRLSSRLAEKATTSLRNHFSLAASWYALSRFSHEYILSRREGRFVVSMSSLLFIKIMARVWHSLARPFPYGRHTIGSRPPSPAYEGTASLRGLPAASGDFRQQAARALIFGLVGREMRPFCLAVSAEP